MLPPAGEQCCTVASSSRPPEPPTLPPADPGTRPGLHGQILVSSGHPDLDRLLGGGLPLGALLLVLDDGWSGHHATLLRYFLAEGAACGQVGRQAAGAGRAAAQTATHCLAEEGGQPLFGPPPCPADPDACRSACAGGRLAQVPASAGQGQGSRKGETLATPRYHPFSDGRVPATDS